MYLGNPIPRLEPGRNRSDGYIELCVAQAATLVCSFLC
jgi:hypothetical protein